MRMKSDFTDYFFSVYFSDRSTDICRTFSLQVKTQCVCTYIRITESFLILKYSFTRFSGIIVTTSEVSGTLCSKAADYIRLTV